MVLFIGLILSLIHILEEFGPAFTKEQMLQVWEQKIPLTGKNGSYGIYWGERQMMVNRLEGLSSEKAGFERNPNVQSVAAWTRAVSYTHLDVYKRQAYFI